MAEGSDPSSGDVTLIAGGDDSQGENTYIVSRAIFAHDFMGTFSGRGGAEFVDGVLVDIDDATKQSLIIARGILNTGDAVDDKLSNTQAKAIDTAIGIGPKYQYDPLPLGTTAASPRFPNNAVDKNTLAMSPTADQTATNSSTRRPNIFTFIDQVDPIVTRTKGIIVQDFKQEWDGEVELFVNLRGNGTVSREERNPYSFIFVAARNPKWFSPTPQSVIDTELIERSDVDSPWVFKSGVTWADVNTEVARFDALLRYAYGGRGGGVPRQLFELRHRCRRRKRCLGCHFQQAWQLTTPCHKQHRIGLRFVHGFPP